MNRTMFSGIPSFSCLSLIFSRRLTGANAFETSDADRRCSMSAGSDEGAEFGEVRLTSPVVLGTNTGLAKKAL